MVLARVVCPVQSRWSELSALCRRFGADCCSARLMLPHAPMRQVLSAGPRWVALKTWHRVSTLSLLAVTADTSRMGQPC